MKTEMNLPLMIISVFAFANGDNPTNPRKPGNRLAGWETIGGKCDFVRRQIKAFGYCWQDENESKSIDTTKERRWVKEVIQQWEKCGGIKFVEEPNCRQGPDFVTIKVGNYHPKVVPIYNNETCEMNAFYMLLDFYTFGEGVESYRRSEKVLESAIKMYSLHEFGHFLGFDHEHNRADKYDCNQVVDDPMVGPKAIWASYNITKEYDPNSIMNYCTKNGHYKPYLSEMDKQGVRTAYGGGNQEECDAVTKPWKWAPGEGLEESTLKELDMEAKGITCYDLNDEQYCQSMTSVCHHEVMHKIYCRKSCGACSPDGGQVVTNFTQPPITDAPAGCADRESATKCAGWKELCHDEGTRFWCAKTCGVC